MSSVLESLKQTACDLTTLEINTIVKHSMTARKMPPPGHAILDIAATYADKLQVSLEIPLGTPFMEQGSQQGDVVHVVQWKQERVERDTLKCDDNTFRNLRRAAYRILEDCPDLDKRDRVIIERIRRNADQLRALLRNLQQRLPLRFHSNDNFLGCNRQQLLNREIKLGRHPKPSIHPDEIALVRKIWDIGAVIGRYLSGLELWFQSKLQTASFTVPLRMSASRVARQIIHQSSQHRKKTSTLLRRKNTE